MQFGDLYDYVSSKGIIIPQTSDVKEKVTTCMKSIFGADVDVADETIIGRFIEAITLLFVDTLGVNAQNANALNPKQAIGSQLDAIGALFGLTRAAGVSDAAFRSQILSSQSRGSGFVESIRNAVLAVDDVAQCTVFNNDTANPKAFTFGARQLLVPAHSIWVGVLGTDSSGSEASHTHSYDEDAVAEAIKNTKSAGCGTCNSNDEQIKKNYSLTLDDGNVIHFDSIGAANIKGRINVSVESIPDNDTQSDIRDFVRQYLIDNTEYITVTSLELIKALTVKFPTVNFLDFYWYTRTSSTPKYSTVLDPLNPQYYLDEHIFINSPYES